MAYYTPISRRADNTTWSNSDLRKAWGDDGYIPRDYSEEPLGSLSYATPFPEEYRIPTRDWPDLIEERDRKELWPNQVRRRARYKSYSQSPTNFCWTWCVMHCLQLDNAMQGEPWTRLSAASVAAVVNDYRNEGGWPGWAAKHIAEHGIASHATWTENKWSRSYNTQASKDDRKLRKYAGYWEIPDNDFELLGSALLRCAAGAAVGRLAWTHATCDASLVLLRGGGFATRLWDSGGRHHGDDGEHVISSRLSQRFEDAIVPFGSGLQPAMAENWGDDHGSIAKDEPDEPEAGEPGSFWRWPKA